MSGQPAALDREFIDVVAKDVRGYLDEETKRWLYSDEMVQRRYQGLIALKKDVEVQLSTQKARWVKKQLECQNHGDNGTEWITFRASEQDWRVRAIKFLISVDHHIAGVKEIRKSVEYDKYKEAIKLHKEEIVDGTEADDQLWATLNA